VSEAEYQDTKVSGYQGLEKIKVFESDNLISRNPLPDNLIF
jgi:hypothetical protein